MLVTDEEEKVIPELDTNEKKKQDILLCYRPLSQSRVVFAIFFLYPKEKSIA